MPKFHNRREAGKILAEKLIHFANKPDVLVLALSRGGIPVAYEVSQKLNVPMDVLVIRKLRTPGHEEVTMGAVAQGGTRVLNEAVIKTLYISDKIVEQVTSEALAEINKLDLFYRSNKPVPIIKNKTVILVDDGLATGNTMKAGIKAVKKQNPSKVIMAVPITDKFVFEEFKPLADQLICCETPENFGKVSLWYDDFAKTSDDEINLLLGKSEKLPAEKVK
jgi:putative phosphoribosyl transferase